MASNGSLQLQDSSVDYIWSCIEQDFIIVIMPVPETEEGSNLICISTLLSIYKDLTKVLKC